MKAENTFQFVNVRPPRRSLAETASVMERRNVSEEEAILSELLGHEERLPEYRSPEEENPRIPDPHGEGGRTQSPDTSEVNSRSREELQSSEKFEISSSRITSAEPHRNLADKKENIEQKNNLSRAEAHCAGDTYYKNDPVLRELTDNAGEIISEIGKARELLMEIKESRGSGEKSSKKDETLEEKIQKLREDLAKKLIAYKKSAVSKYGSPIILPSDYLTSLIKSYSAALFSPNTDELEIEAALLIARFVYLLAAKTSGEFETRLIHFDKISIKVDEPDFVTQGLWSSSKPPEPDSEASSQQEEFIKALEEQKNNIEILEDSLDEIHGLVAKAARKKPEVVETKPNTNITRRRGGFLFGLLGGFGSASSSTLSEPDRDVKPIWLIKINSLEQATRDAISDRYNEESEVSLFELFEHIEKLLVKANSDLVAIREKHKHYRVYAKETP